MGKYKIYTEFDKGLFLQYRVTSSLLRPNIKTLIKADL